VSEKLQVDEIPRLIVVSASGDLISCKGVEEVNVGSDKALIRWSQGRALFWSRPARVGEYLWFEKSRTFSSEIFRSESMLSV
jgi:hypothetical protein